MAPMPIPDIKEDLLKQKRWQVSISGGLYEYYQPNILTFSYFKNAVLYEGKQFPRFDGQYAVSAGYNPFCNFWINAGLGARHYSERFNYSSYYVPHAPPNYEMQNVRYEQFSEN